MRIKKILEFPVILATLAVLVFGFVCTNTNKHASMHDDINSVATIRAGNQQECCSTSISKYIESIKDNLWVISREISDILILFILGIAIASTIGYLKSRFDFTDLHLTRYKLYERNNPNIILFNGLKLAFARGILNSKVF